jgi:hypothetical protein
MPSLAEQREWLAVPSLAGLAQSVPLVPLVVKPQTSLSDRWVDFLSLLAYRWY